MKNFMTKAISRTKSESAPDVRLTNRGEHCVANSHNHTLPAGCEKYLMYFKKFVWASDEAE